MILPRKSAEREAKLEKGRQYAKRQYHNKSKAEIQEYNQRPEVKERKRKDANSAKGKLRFRLYRLKPEKKEMHRAESQRYNLKPEVIAHRKKRMKKPDVIVKRKMWSIGYRARRNELGRKYARTPEAKKARKDQEKKPEVRAKIRAYVNSRKNIPEVKAKTLSAALRSYYKNREKIKQETEDLKIEALTPYSKKYSKSNVPCCACFKCREKEIKFLTIDHIDGRRRMGHPHSLNGKQLYKWIIKNNFPDGLQVMCFNCNIAKGFFGKCPHQKEN